MVLFNIGSKYILIDVSKSQDYFLKTKVARRFTLFCIFFVATRDIVTSLILTVLFVVVVFNFFHEESELNVVPKSFYDTTYTIEEYDMAKKIVSAFESASKPASSAVSEAANAPEGDGAEYSAYTAERSFGSNTERSDFESAHKSEKKLVNI